MCFCDSVPLATIFRNRDLPQAARNKLRWKNLSDTRFYEVFEPFSETFSDSLVAPAAIEIEILT
jgi:hypothetical protein